MEAKALLTPPGETESIFDDNICSNFDHEINQQIVGEVRQGKIADYPGWNFHATVWFADGQFHAKIMQYLVHVATLSAETFPELKDEICNEFGND